MGKYREDNEELCHEQKYGIAGTGLGLGAGDLMIWPDSSTK